MYIRDDNLAKAGAATRLLQNEDFKVWFDGRRESLISRLETSPVNHTNQWETLELLRDFQGHMRFKQELVKFASATERTKPQTADRV